MAAGATWITTKIVFATIAEVRSQKAKLTMKANNDVLVLSERAPDVVSTVSVSQMI